MLARSPGVPQLRRPAPGTEERCTRTRLHLEDGSDAGQATYAVLVKPGEEILVGNGRRFRILAVVPFADEEESPFVGLLQVEAV
jgi:hypothetical protein